MVYNQTHSSKNTIAACASAQGKAGVALIRISGPQSWSIGEALAKTSFKRAGLMKLVHLHDSKDQLIDEAMAVSFRRPASFTGEDTVELHCHGSPLVVEMLLEQIYLLGATPAEPGEFSKRAFLNNKIDLTKAEAIADLIDASSRQAARNALQSMQGAFAEQINQLVYDLTQLRVLIEANIDFPEEDADSGDMETWSASLKQIHRKCLDLYDKAEQGCRINNGFRLVLLGAPNSGKSSLFNALLQQDHAIVTDQAGTTRDLLQKQWQLGGLQLELTDTAGIRASGDTIESLGIEKALNAAATADLILYLFDDDNPDFDLLERFTEQQIILIRSKVDIANKPADISTARHQQKSWSVISVSSKTGAGMELLIKALNKHLAGENQQENLFSARQRHLDALDQATKSIDQALGQLTNTNQIELCAQDLLEAQTNLGHITGMVSADDLLGEIFSSFCIGK